MPATHNPAGGWFVSANNDAAGTTLGNAPLSRLRPGGGIYYLNYGYDGIRAGRIEQILRQRLAAGRKVSMADMETMQADTTLLDAEYFVPHITQAFTDAKTSSVPQLAALGADPQVAEAARRLGQWDLTTPTGIAQGYDAGRAPASPPSQDQIADSVPPPIYPPCPSPPLTHIIADHPPRLPTPDHQHALTAMEHR